MKYLTLIKTATFIMTLSASFNAQGNPNDQFFDKQWGNENIGQIISKGYNEIYSTTFEGVPGTDIGVSNIYDQLPSIMKKEVTVAVIDSGIDLEHPDLKDNIKRNMPECLENGNLDPQNKEDRDQNGLAGDCMGWNFTVPDNSPIGPRSYDNTGHGTHVAGIIAAISNNGIGISGVAPKIKVLPVKVLSKNSKNRIGKELITDIFAKGVRYATKMKVDVINMSLGWPLVMNTENIKNAVKEAVDSGIIVVVAAGNNSNGYPQFPCSYEGVICVSSISVDGTFSNFSNFGGKVDLLAPGDQILSLYPSKLHSKVFSLDGYEIKNGTSQAAPYVSAAAAILKSAFPNIKKEEVLARLAESTYFQRPVKDETKFANHGLINIEKSIKIEKKTTIRPSFKSLDIVQIDSLTKKFKFKLPIQNLWAKSKNIKVEISTNSNNIVLDKSIFNIPAMSTGEIKSIKISGKVKNMSAQSEFSISVKITDNGNAQGTFKNDMEFSKSLDLSEIETMYEIKPAAGAKKIEIVDKKKSQFILKPISDSYKIADFPEYYIAQKNTKKPKSTFDLLFFKKTPQNTMQERGKKISLENTKAVLSIRIADMNLDGEKDYFIISAATTGRIDFVYTFLDKDLNPLYGKYSTWKHSPKKTILGKDFSIMKYHSPKLGIIGLPIYADIGLTPEEDLEEDPWGENPDQYINHIYYLEPQINGGEVNLRSRIVDTLNFRKSLRERLNIDWNDFVKVNHVEPQATEDRKKGITKVILSIGREYQNKYIQLKLKTSTDYKTMPLENNYMEFQGARVKTLIKIDNNKFDSSAGSIIYKYPTDASIRQLIFDGSTQPIADMSYQQKDIRDTFSGLLRTYNNNGEIVGLYQSRYHIIAISPNKETQIVPMNRFSFLNKTEFSDRIYSVVASDGDKKVPAILVDHTDISKNRIYLLKYMNNKLIKPIKTNLALPDNCHNFDYANIGENRNYHFTFICKKPNGNWALSYKVMD